MDRSELEERLLALGSDLDHWPPAEAEAARRLLAVDPLCHALFAEVAAIDNAVREATFAPLDAALVGRILTSTRKPPHAVFSEWRRLVPAGALVILLIAGVGFKAGYDEGVARAGEPDLAALVVGDIDSFGNMP